jgi:hypothetical protein
MQLNKKGDSLFLIDEGKTRESELAVAHCMEKEKKEALYMAYSND